MRISDWSSDVCSSDLAPRLRALARRHRRRLLRRPRPAAGARRPGRAMSRAMHRSLFARIEAKRDDLVALTRDLIRFPTVNPPGEAYTPCAEYLGRSEEHTSELQSLMRNSYAVFCLKKKNQKKT